MSIAAAVVSAYSSQAPSIEPRKETAGEEAERWYNERKTVYAKDYSAPWFKAAKITALLGAILIAVMSMLR